MSTNFKLRPYQKAAVGSVVARYFDQQQRRMLLYLPTGAGKTVIATFIIKALRRKTSLGRTLFIAHRREILDQTAHALRQHLPELSVQVEQGERKALAYGRAGADIIVASVQSLLRRKEQYEAAAFGLIICDECHHALAESWEQVIDYFSRGSNKQALLLGMTATPRRSDGRSALELFGETAFEISRTDLEDLGYLVQLRYFTVHSELRLADVKLSGGDFQAGALSRIMDSAAQRALAVKAWLEQGCGKRTIVFCASVEHARHLAEDFQALGISAAKIDGKTKDRREVLERFQRDELQVLTNYGVLTEGFDDPGVSCILMARPTTSPLVYTQCIGRGLRCAPGKAACTVIDLVDRSTHQLQYGALQMAGLPARWHSRGGDPFRQAKSLKGIKVTSPEAFLRIREASSLENVQAILMSLPPGVVIAGLDGEPVVRYTPANEDCSAERAEAEVRQLLKQAGVRGARLSVEDDLVRIRFRNPEIDNERYAYLNWHLARATGRRVAYATSTGRQRRLNPRALLKSMLPEHCRIETLEHGSTGDAVWATVVGLLPEEMASISHEFQDASGVQLKVTGQMSLF